jgi:hypothetical protein
MNLDNLKRFETETVITENFAVTVERTGRGSFATVSDEASEFNGQYAFASVPSVAFGMLMQKIAAVRMAA